MADGPSDTHPEVRDAPPPDRRTGSGRLIASARMEQFTGPLPPPNIMSAYGAVDPSFPERIMAMAEREQAHAHAMDAEEHGLVRFDVGARWKATGRGSQYGLAALVAI